MTYETFPDGSKIPTVGLGTWQIGGGMTADTSPDDNPYHRTRTIYY